MSETKCEPDKTARLPSALCWVALALFAASLVFPALRVQGKGEWVAGDVGLNCAFLSLAEFPSWVPNVLVIAAPFIAKFTGKSAQKAFGVVLGITTLTALQVCFSSVALTLFRHGSLPGFWLWAAALISASAGLLLGGFSPVRTPKLEQVSPEVPLPSRTRPRGAILVCWLAFAIFVVTNLGSLGLFLDGSLPRGLSRHAFFALDQVAVPALLAMAPLACIYGGGRTQRFLALAVGLLGLLPFFSIDRPAEQPFEVLAPVLVSFLPVALAVAGLLASAGSMNRNRNAPAELAKAASGERPSHQSGRPEVSRVSARGNRPLGAALCWLALVHSLGLGALAFDFVMVTQSAKDFFWMISPHQPTVMCSLLAMAPCVCAFSGPEARRFLGTLLAMSAVMTFWLIWLFEPRVLTEVIALCLSAAGLFWKVTTHG